MLLLLLALPFALPGCIRAVLCASTVLGKPFPLSHAIGPPTVDVVDTKDSGGGFIDVLSAMEVQRKLGAVSEEFWARCGTESQEPSNRDLFQFS